MRTGIRAALALGMLIALQGNGRAQDGSADRAAQAASAEASQKTPLQIIDECVRAIEQQDIATYVDHLSRDEQRTQAGFALILSSYLFSAASAQSELAEPELLLLMRAIDDLVREHAVEDLHSNGNALYGQAAQPSMPTFTMVMTEAGLVAQPQGVNTSDVRGMFMKSADRLKDPRLFLTAVLTEFSRPVEVAGAEPGRRSSVSHLAEYAKLYGQQKWTLYTRGDYAVAAAVAASANKAAPQPDGEPQPPSVEASETLRIEFKRIDGVWKISHLLPVALCSELASVTPGICTGPQCATNGPSYVPSYAPAGNPYPSSPVAPPSSR